MKIYIDFSKQAITKIDSDVAYVGDVYSNVFVLLFYNYGVATDWFPTMSQLAPNGREAGDFSADALEENESHTYTEDGVTYQKFDFTIGDGWVRMKGRSNFFIWVNKLVDSNTSLQRKCYGKLMVTLNESTDNYFIQDAYLNPKVKEYIDNTIGDDLETYKATIDDEVEAQNETIASLMQASPSVFDTASNIQLLQENKGVAVATDTGYIYYWDSTLSTPVYVSSGLVYNEPEIADGSIHLTKLNADVIEYIDEQGKPTQQQVDNWLDEHPEATTTTNYEVNNKIYNSINQLIADTTLKANDKISLYGYNNLNDGCHIDMVIRTAENNENPNNITTYLLNNGYIAEVSKSSVININSFGIFGDNLTDYSTKLQAVIDTFGSVGVTLYFPKGTYIFNNINIPYTYRAIKFIGDRATRNNKTVFKCPLDASNDMFTIGNHTVSTDTSVNSFYFDFTCENIFFMGASAMSTTADRTNVNCFNLNRCSDVLFLNCDIYGFAQNGILMTDCRDSLIENCTFTLDGTFLSDASGIKFVGVNDTTNAIRINNSRFENNKLSIYITAKVQQIVFSNTKIEKGVYGGSDYLVYIASLFYITFTSCILNLEEGTLIKFNSNDGYLNTIFNGCQFNNADISKKPTFINSNGMSGIGIVGCTCFGLNENAFILGDCNTITGNLFRIVVSATNVVINNAITVNSYSNIKDNIFYSGTYGGGNLIHLAGSHNQVKGNRFLFVSNVKILIDNPSSNVSQSLLDTVRGSANGTLDLDIASDYLITASSTISLSGGAWEKHIVSIKANVSSVTIPASILSNQTTNITLNANDTAYLIYLNGWNLFTITRWN